MNPVQLVGISTLIGSIIFLSLHLGIHLSGLSLLGKYGAVPKMEAVARFLCEYVAFCAAWPIVLAYIGYQSGRASQRAPK